jgi:hypothetical protein
MNNFIIRDVLGWGVLLWLAGYLLGFVFYAFVPPAFIGWFVMPLGIGLTCLVLWKWVRVDTIRDSLLLGIGWSAIAIVCDYFFLVKLLNPPDGYYKLDVYLYYLITCALPVAFARLRRGVVV